MSEAVYLFLKIAGVEIQGESPVKSLGRENAIPCLSFDQAVSVPTSGVTASAARSYAPLLIRKAIDKATPLLAKALTANQVVEAQFRFYRPNPSGDGTEEQYLTIAIKNARITSQRIQHAAVPDAQGPRLPTIEEIAFVFRWISWTYTKGGVTHEDSLPGRG